jgi:PST family polysaccharide transporter
MSINKEIKRGVFHSAIFKYANYFVNLLVSMVLARLLTPEEFGVIAVINVAVMFFLMLSALGMGEAIVQNPNLTDHDLYSLFIISIIIAFIFSLGFFLSGNLIANFYSNTEYIKITHFLSLSLFFQTANTIPYHYLRKIQKFKLLGSITLITAILSGTSAVILAVNGFSYYSLVYKSIIESLLSFIICSKFIRIKKHKYISFKAFSRYFSYSIFQFLANSLWFFSRSIDIIVIGKYLGTTSIGYYERGTRLFSTITGLSEVFSPVLHPILSNHQNDLGLIYKVFIKLTKLISLLGIPFSILLYFSSAEIIIILYGNQWVKTIPAFQYMAFMIWMNILISVNTSFFQALGKTNTLFIYGIIYTFVLTTAIAVGVFIEKSFVMVAFYILVSHIILLIISYYFLVIRLFKKEMVKFLMIFKPGIILGISMIILHILLVLILNGMNIYLLLLLKLILSGTILFFLLRILKEYNGLFELIKEKHK